jgi:hypothetical protein
VIIAVHRPMMEKERAVHHPVMMMKKKRDV